MARLLVLLSAAATVLASPAMSGEAAPDAAILERDVRVLADDTMEGREAGTRGYDMAAGYVAGRFASLGLEPAGEDGSYFQTVKMSTRMYGPAADTRLELDGRKLAGPVDQDDFMVLGSAGHPAGSVEAPLVFVGYGFAAEGHSRDDFAGIDLAGKIAVYLSGAPGSLNTEERAHYRTTLRKRLSERGAVGTIRLYPPSAEERNSYARSRELSASSVSVDWIGPDGTVDDDAPALQFSASVSGELAARMLAGQPVDWKRITKIDAGAKDDAMRSFDMGITARVSWANRTGSIDSSNVVGLISGSDPKLADEFVVLTGHLDHVGIRPTAAEGDDELHNGAMDNAVGIAALLEVARLLTAEPPRRSTLILALTAEEKGLIGADYFAHYPTVPRSALVANVNLDMPIVTYAFEDVVAFGAERSTLFPVIEAAAARAGVRLSPDPVPHEGLFTRSDHYRFVEQGIPAVYLMPGHAGPGREANEEFLNARYHKPGDEIALVDFAQLARFTAVNHEIARGIADLAERPVWNKGDFFAQLFGGRMAD